jgi:hypothetical protein
MRPAWPVPVLLLAVLAGCSDVDTSPIDSGVPTASSTGSARPLPSAGGHWKGFASQCPELTGAAAKELGVAGPGSPTDQYSTSDTVTQADCHWGSSDGGGDAVNARISIWARPEAADAQWRTLSTGQGTPLDVGDEGFVADEPGAVVVRTRSGNAVATVRLVPSKAHPDTGPLRPAAGDITNDVLDDLVAG